MTDYSTGLQELRKNFLISKQPPQHLTHYTDAAGAIGIISKEKIWSSSFECMNDNGELRHGITLWREPVNDFLNSVVELGEEEEIILKGWNAFMDSELELPMMRPYISSFICGEESAYHWASYGGRGKGISIDFDFKDINQMGSSIIAEVVYDDCKKSKIIADVIRDLRSFMQKWTSKQNNLTN